MQKALLDAFLWLSLRLNGFGGELADTLVSLSRLETGHYSSTAFTRHRNAFGMGVVQTRPTPQVGGHANADAGIGHYGSLYSSVRDLRMWFDYWELPRDRATPRMWELYNPSPSYQTSVMGTRHQIGRGLSVLAFIFPITIIVIRKLIHS
jgi:hypothetical protein